MNAEQLTEYLAKLAPAAFVFTDLLQGQGRLAEVAIVSPRYVLGAELDYGNSVDLRGYGLIAHVVSLISLCSRLFHLPAWLRQ